RAHERSREALDAFELEGAPRRAVPRRAPHARAEQRAPRGHEQVPEGGAQRVLGPRNEREHTGREPALRRLDAAITRRRMQRELRAKALEQARLIFGARSPELTPAFAARARALVVHDARQRLVQDVVAGAARAEREVRVLAVTRRVPLVEAAEVVEQPGRDHE